MSRPQETLILGTAGHIDHGKTALVKALTGTDTDRLPDEKRRGITIDLGFAVLRQGETTISIIDVPGHERFIRNMLAGAGGFDMAMLVVAADDGVMPQTLEHLEILSLLGIPKGIVAMTKCDLVSEEWQDLVEQEIRDRLVGTFLERSPIMRVSTLSSEGLEELKRMIFDLAADFERVELPSPFRLSVDRVFVKSGFGVVATGTVGAGTISVGDTVRIHPGMEIARVRSLQSHGLQVKSASSGQRLAVNLAGVKGDALARGVEISDPEFLQESRWLAVRIKALEKSPSHVKHRGVYRLHIGTADVEAKLILSEHSQLSDEMPVVALIRTAEPIAAVHGRPFVLRSVSPAMTLAGGRVLWPTARLIRRRDKTAWRLVSELDAEDHAARLAAWMTLSGYGRPDDSTAIRELGITAHDVSAAAEKLVSDGRILRLIKPGLGSAFEITRESADNLLARIRRRLSNFHRDNPRLTAMAINQLTGRIADVPAEQVLALLNSESARSIVVIRDGMVSLVGFKPQLTQAEQKLRKTIWDELRQGGLTPPLLEEFSKSTGTKSSVLIDVLRILVSEGLVDEIGDGLFLSKEISTTVVEKVRDRFSEKEALAVSELKETLGVSRKYAVPIVEWLDRCGVTRREGDLRFLVFQENSMTNEKASPQ